MQHLGGTVLLPRVFNLVGVLGGKPPWIEVNSSARCNRGSMQLTQRLAANKAVHFMAIGSSVTGAHGGCTHGLNPVCPEHCGGECYKPARAGKGWLRKTVDWLAAVRNATHRAYNAGKGATHMEHYSRCLDSYWPPVPIHVVVLEVTIFSACRGGISHLEKLVRSLQMRSDPPAILFVRFHSTWHVARGRRYGGLGRCDDRLHLLTRHYGLASIFLADESTWPAEFGEHAQQLLINGEGVHPNPTAGEQVMALMTATALRETEAAGASCNAAPTAMPPPLFFGTDELISVGCYSFEDASLKKRSNLTKESEPEVFLNQGLLPPATVVARLDWEYVVELSAGRRKPGLVANLPGSVVDVQIVSSAWRTVSTQGGGERALVAVLEYLVSYDLMGIAHISCHEACVCEPREINAHAKLPKFSTHASCMLNLTRNDGGIGGYGGGGGSGLPILDGSVAERSGNSLDATARDAELWRPANRSGSDRCIVRVALTNRTTSGQHKFKLVGLTVAARALRRR